MKEPWTGDLVGKMHIHEITFDELASECGWVKGYVSMILNGQRNPKDAREKMESALDAIISRKSGSR